MIKAIFFDVDGTLISNKRLGINESVVLALKVLKKQGIKLFIATGRHYFELNELKINEQFIFDGYLTLNGGYCFDVDGTTIYSNPINKNDVLNIVNYAIDNNLACSFVERNDMYINLVNDYVKKSHVFLNTEIPAIKDINKALNNDIYQIDPFVEEEILLDMLSKTKNCKYTKWYDYGYDVIPKTGGKQKGIEAMLKYYHLSPQEIMAFGDGENDIDMLMKAGIGVCMENGHPHTKKISDFVTKSVDDDGIVYALKHFGMI